MGVMLQTFYWDCPRGIKKNYSRTKFNFPLTNPRLSHRIAPNMFSPCFNTMSMTTTSGNLREDFVLGQK